MTASDASTGSLQNPAQAARKVVGEAFTAAWAAYGAIIIGADLRHFYGIKRRIILLVASG